MDNFEAESEAIEPPDLHSWLLSFLDERKREYDRQFDVETSGADSEAIAIGVFAARASELVTSGVVPEELASLLGEYMPDDSLITKLRSLLDYTVVRHKIEFDVAETVCENLNGLDSRVALVAIITKLLLGYVSSSTATKYFMRATRLYLAGYNAETTIMCGAVLEAALRSRFEDETLRNAGEKPAYRQADDFSVSQRMRYEEKNPVFSKEEREQAVSILRARNDAVHVQPDVIPDPLQILVALAFVLRKLLPNQS